MKRSSIIKDVLNTHRPPAISVLYRRTRGRWFFRGCEFVGRNQPMSGRLCILCQYRWSLDGRLRQCKSSEMVPINSAAYSIAMSGTEARLCVTWKHQELNYYMQDVESFCFRNLTVTWSSASTFGTSLTERKTHAWKRFRTHWTISSKKAGDFPNDEIRVPPTRP